MSDAPGWKSGASLGYIEIVAVVNKRGEFYRERSNVWDEVEVSMASGDGREWIMKRITLVLVAGALMLALTAGVAVAQKIIRCDSEPCVGTVKEDRIYERAGDGLDDTIRGKDRGDVIDAADFNADNDNIFGGRGNDRIRVDDRDIIDFVSCGKGNKDIAIVNRLDEAAGNCEEVRSGLRMPDEEFANATPREIIADSVPAE